jgi:hypothetical protein
MNRIHRRRLAGKARAAGHQAQRQQRRATDPNASLRADMKERLAVATTGQEKLAAPDKAGPAPEEPEAKAAADRKPAKEKGKAKPAAEPERGPDQR